jgi:hypothetical protein
MATIRRLTKATGASPLTLDDRRALIRDLASEATDLRVGVSETYERDQGARHVIAALLARLGACVDAMYALAGTDGDVGSDDVEAAANVVRDREAVLARRA